MRYVLATVVLLSPLASAGVLAHNLAAECQVRGKQVVLEAFFSDDTPAPNAKVTVRDDHKAVVAEGKTDAGGVWTFPTPPDGRYEIVVDAGDGHRTTLVLTLPVAETAGKSRGELTAIPWLR